MKSENKKNILLLCTGGTIASVESEDGFSPSLNGDDILKYIPSMKGYCNIDIVQVFNIDSTNMLPKHWSVITRAIKENYKKYDGFVILHGTDTMAYTAAALSYMIQNSQKPIILTGSQKPICLDITDAKTNLIDSILYACDDKSAGVQIVFDGCAIAGTRAKKTHAHSYDAFSSVNFPVIATIQNMKIIRYLPKEVHESEVEFAEELNENVAVLKLIPGSKPELLEYMFSNYDCLIIEGFGVGGIPETLRDVFYKCMKKYADEGKIAIIATQVMNEGSNMEVYEVGQKVKKEFNLIETYDMTFEAAITKIMYLLKKHKNDINAIQKAFYTTINYDILYPDKE